MNKMSIYDLCILHDHFARKNDPSEEDRARIQKMDDILRHLVDTTIEDTSDKMSISEIFEKLTGENIKDYK